MEPLLRIKAVAKLVGCSPSTIYRHVEAGLFPKPVRYGVKITAWRSEDIEAWIESISAKHEASLNLKDGNPQQRGVCV